jgi:hypothetical protein
MQKTIIAIIFSTLPAQLYAYCDGGKYPDISVSEEIQKTEFIVIGTVKSRKIVVDPKEDPEGYEAEIFHVDVEKTLYGAPPAYLDKQFLRLYNDNTSSRFPMDEGQKYLLFVSSGSDGFWVNSCGNSGKLNVSMEVIKGIQLIVGDHHK